MILTVTLNAAIDKRYVVDDFKVGEVNPVSYTHLDVYKRQVFGLLFKGIFSCK